jgi:predicted small lipoprotein YifL
MTNLQCRFTFLAVAALLASSLAGCGGEGHERYIPPADTARTAVEAALSAWKAGEPLRTITTHTPPVDFYDARRQAGKKLEDFQIVEEIPGDPYPSFKVKLRLAGKKPGPAGKAQEDETTYLVVGIDPLQVFRKEDYAQPKGM